MNKFTDDENPTMDIIGKQYTLDETIRLRNFLKERMNVEQLVDWITVEIDRIQHRWKK